MEKMKHGISKEALITAWDFWKKSKEEFPLDDFKRFIYCLTEFMGLGVMTDFELPEEHKRVLAMALFMNHMADRSDFSEVEKMLKANGMLDPE